MVRKRAAEDEGIDTERNQHSDMGHQGHTKMCSLYTIYSPLKDDAGTNKALLGGIEGEARGNYILLHLARCFCCWACHGPMFDFYFSTLV